MNGTRAPEKGSAVGNLRIFEIRETLMKQIKGTNTNKLYGRVKGVLIPVLIGALIFSMAACGNKAKEEPVEEEVVEEVVEEPATPKYPHFDDLEDPVGSTKLGIMHRNAARKPDWKALKKECKDILGWIWCHDSVIDYPIAQGTDNDYYLNNTHKGVYDGVGIPFLDYRNEKPFEGFLTVLYGHRMKDGSMLKLLSYYFYPDGEDHYDEYPIYEIYTPEKNYALKVFAWARVSEIDGYTYDFELCNGKETKEAKQAYLDYVASINQLKHPKYSATVDDKIVLMSICTAELDSDREVVWGKLVPLE